MPDQQIPAGLKTRCEPIDELLLRRLVEVDHHIAAEDHVKERWRVKRIHQVQAPEFDHPADQWFDPKPSFPVAGAAQQIFLRPVPGKVPESLSLVDRSLGRRQSA